MNRRELLKGLSASPAIAIPAPAKPEPRYVPCMDCAERVPLYYDYGMRGIARVTSLSAQEIYAVEKSPITHWNNICKTCDSPYPIASSNSVTFGPSRVGPTTFVANEIFIDSPQYLITTVSELSELSIFAASSGQLLFQGKVRRNGDSFEDVTI